MHPPQDIPVGEPYGESSAQLGFAMVPGHAGSLRFGNAKPAAYPGSVAYSIAVSAGESDLLLGRTDRPNSER